MHREGENRETAVKNGTFEAASMKRGSGILSVHDIKSTGQKQRARRAGRSKKKQEERGKPEKEGTIMLERPKTAGKVYLLPVEQIEPSPHQARRTFDEKELADLWQFLLGSMTGGSDALTPDGNLTLIDDIGSSTKAGKQFITLESKNGNVFYMIIDRDDEGEETVHFLNQVDEADLMALTGEEETPAVCSCTTKCVAGTVNTSCPVCAVNMTECVGKEAKPEVPAEPTEPAAEEPEKKSGVGGILVVLLILALGGGAAFYFFKQKKAKPQTKGSADLDDYDYGEDEDEYEFEPYEDEPEQDTTEDTDA